MRLFFLTPKTLSNLHSKKPQDYFKYEAIFLRSLLIIWLKSFYCLWTISKLWSFFFLSQTSRYMIHEFAPLKLYTYNFSWSDYLIRFSVKSISFFNSVSPLQAVAFFSLSHSNLILVPLSIIFFRKLPTTFSVVIQLHSKFFEVLS